jgi:drug/metabolite transporter (DMT)-like permease
MGTIPIHLQSLFLCLLAGIFLGQRFRVPTLIAAAAVLALVAVVSVMRGEGFWSSALNIVAAAVSLQIGYMLGLGIRYLLADKHAAGKSEPTRRTIP